MKKRRWRRDKKLTTAGGQKAQDHSIYSGSEPMFNDYFDVKRSLLTQEYIHYHHLQTYVDGNDWISIDDSDSYLHSKGYLYNAQTKQISYPANYGFRPPHLRN
jgi:hypothetical protein